ncbi:hypothetical protein Golomagni_07146 [Golovinomyces magnicellulatus]|nr:hypothetical protein Golomagni_07146 [Golovinomyces magnicellulatus]
MTDTGVSNGNGALEETLARLSKKPGVKASIILDRTSGAILKTSGDLSSFTTTKSRTATTAASFSNEAGVAEDSETKGLEDYAAMIWNFVNNSGQMVQDIDSEDELKLLRLRTKKQETVIVIDPKYLMTVIHDTPTV